MTPYILSLVAWVALLAGVVALVESIRNRRSLRRFRSCDKSKCASMVEQAIAKRASSSPPLPQPKCEPLPSTVEAKRRAELTALRTRLLRFGRGYFHVAGEVIPDNLGDELAVAKAKRLLVRVEKSLIDLDARGLLDLDPVIEVADDELIGGVR